MGDYLPGVAVIDIEATSLDTAKGAIASVGMVTFRSGELKRLYRVFAPFRGAKIEKSAMKVNGFTLTELRRADKPELATHCIAKFMRENRCHTLAGQNPAFDKSYINAYLKRYGKHDVLSHRLIDMHSIAYAYLAAGRAKIPTERVGGYVRNGLSATRIYKLLGMPKEPTPHNALTGALFEFEGLCRLIYGKRALPQFRRYRLKVR